MSGRAVLAVRVTPRGGRDAVDGVAEDGSLRLRVAAAPADGAANTSVIRVLAKALGVPRSAIRIEGGATGRHKRLSVAGVEAASIRTHWPGVSVRDG